MANTSAFEGVPWMVRGGKHTGDLGRVLAYAATGGSEGVVQPSDWKVSATPGTPNGTVHVSAGAGAILNRSAGGEGQSYITRSSGVSDRDVAPTGASPRSDLVVVRIKDPQFAPHQGNFTPTSVADGPYVFPEIIPGVPAGTTQASQVAALAGQSAYAVARIDMPAGKTAVQQDYIKELRQLISPRSESLMYVEQGPPNVTQQFLPITDENWRQWPTNTHTLFVPAWATHFIAVASLIGVGANGPVVGEFRAMLDSLTGAVSHIDKNGGQDSVGNVEAFDVQAVVQLEIPTAWRGTWRTLSMQGRRTWTSTATGQMWMGSWQQVRYEWQFYEKAL